MRNIIILIFSLFLCACFIISKNINTAYLKVSCCEEIDDEYHVKLRIYAEYGESAWGFDDIHNIREGDKIYIVGKLKFESLGSFKTTLDIPKDVNEVYFCSRKIWSRSNE